MSEYQFIAVVQDGNTCEPMEQVINEKGETVAANSVEYYQTIGEHVDLKNSDFADGLSQTAEEIIEEGVVDQGPASFVVSAGSGDVLPAEALVSSSNNDEDADAVTLNEESDIIDIKLRTLLLPLGMKLPNTDLSFKERRKRTKSSLFIGYTEEASDVMKEFERLKADLNIKTNIEMLQRLMMHYMKQDMPHVSTCVEDTSGTETDKQERIKALEQILPEDSEVHRNQNESGEEEQDDNAEDFPVNVFNVPEQEVTNVLGLTALNIKTIQLSKKYLENVKKDGFYISGFVDSSEKLDEFLKLFRLITGSSFSIRRSKVKINDDPDPEEKPLRKYKPGYLGKGQIKWEKNIGIPPIPFTGIPFTTEGSTTYQCIHGPKRIKLDKTLDQSADEDSSLVDGCPAKKRRGTRESKKKDCPAQIHIRTVHRFPTYNCVSSLEPEKSTMMPVAYVNKCQRGIILAKLREDIVNEKVEGEQGFWIRVPLPEVHQNHSLGPFDSCEPPLNEQTIIEMKNILHQAAISS